MAVFPSEGKHVYISDKVILSGLEGCSPGRPVARGRMVRILANGEIVPDDDPRVRNTAPSRSSTPRQVGARCPRQGQGSSWPPVL